MLYSALIRELASLLDEAGIDNPQREAHLIVKTVDSSDEAAFFLKKETDCPKKIEDKARVFAARRAEGEPFSRIVGTREFYGRDFHLSAATLDPRPDSEILIDAVLKKFGRDQAFRFIDLGTGSGCLAITLLAERPHARGIAVDLSHEALEMARKNAAANSVSERLETLQGSWWENVPHGEVFDLVISNPPYIPSAVIPTLAREVQNHDPILALDGGDTGLQSYQEILSQLNLYLSQAGHAFFEVGQGQAEDVARLAEDIGATLEGISRDYGGISRVVHISRGDK
ncbi:MAG: peptide chain release factor N(5)-glutamine methyltransferase [Pseudobdellovibrionaceae bacterium]